MMPRHRNRSDASSNAAAPVAIARTAVDGRSSMPRHVHSEEEWNGRITPSHRAGTSSVPLPQARRRPAGCFVIRSARMGRADRPEHGSVEPRTLADLSLRPDYVDRGGRPAGAWMPVVNLPRTPHE